ncbi:hypothetical protein RclHR1_03300023 [Rhizophagus clarus]|nr:hypothetical protein RclHR1_03300023 [Rhizophagus clarus]
MDCFVDYPSDGEKHLELATFVKGQGEHNLVNGYYVIRNPSGVRSEILEDPEELEKTTIRALIQHRVWRDVPSNRFCLQNLTINLSELQREAQERSSI